MAEKYSSLLALVLDAGLDDVGEVVAEAVAAGDIDRAMPVRQNGSQAQEVHWGGRMQRAVIRAVRDDDGAPLLRIEAYIGNDGVSNGMQRQAALLQALARRLRGRVASVRDISARTERDQAWMNRLAVGAVERGDAIVAFLDGVGVRWVRTHGAARFDVPDLEVYGLHTDDVDAAVAMLAHVHDQLLREGLKASLALPDGTPVYLVPVLEAWRHTPLDWPGVGRAGQARGPGLDGPRASLSVLHPPRLGRYRKDLAGVRKAIGRMR